MQHVRFLTVLVFLLLIVNTMATVFVVYKTEQSLLATTAEAIGTSEAKIGFCMNLAPVLDVPCNTTMRQDRSYYCRLNATDAEGGITYFQIPMPPDNVSIFAISAGGEINFTPGNNVTGNHSSMLGIDDNSGCENAYDYYWFNFTVQNVNDPPYLIRNIPNQTFDSGTVLQAVFLNDYFADPDNDPLAFSYVEGVAETQVNITLSNASHVTFTSNGCGDAYFQFSATDPGNLSAESSSAFPGVTATRTGCR